MAHGIPHYLLTGQAGQSVKIVGENLYRIDRIVFGSVDARSFRVYALPNGIDIIDAVVPAGASYGKVQISSTVRDITGYSLVNFIPTPLITGIVPATGIPSSSVRLLGNGFSGVTGVSVNNILCTGIASPDSGLSTDYRQIDGASSSNIYYGFSVDSNNDMRIQIPSGNTHGKIKIHARSGLNVITSSTFAPETPITGFSPLSGRANSEVTVRGENFDPSIMSQVDSNKFLVTFSPTQTGQFEYKSDTELFGRVPDGAVTGPVSVNRTKRITHLSTGFYKVIPPPPVIDLVQPRTGGAGTIFKIYGENFSDIKSVELSGLSNSAAAIEHGFLGTGHIKGAEFLVVNSSQIRVTAPEAPNGRYSPAIKGQFGTVTGDIDNSGNYFFLAQKPIMSGFAPTSGAPGTSVSVTGKFLYGQTQVYLADQTKRWSEGNTRGLTKVPITFAAPGPAAKFPEIRFNVPQPRGRVTDYEIVIDNGFGGVSSLGLTSNYPSPTNDNRFNLVGVPSISGLSSGSGIEGKSTLTVTGDGFRQVSDVSIIVGETSFDVPYYTIENGIEIFQTTKSNEDEYTPEILGSIVSGLPLNKELNTERLEFGYGNGGILDVGTLEYQESSHPYYHKYYTVEGLKKPTLFLTAGKKYEFDVNPTATGFSFYLSTDQGGGSGFVGVSIMASAT